MRSILRPGAGLLALSIVVLLTAYLCPSSAGYAQTRPGRKGPTGVKPTPAPETPGVAQKPQPAPRKVTVNLRNGDPVTGSLLKADAETIELEVAGNRLTIKWDDVSSVTTPGAVEAKPAESAGSPGAGGVAPGPAAGASEQKAAPQTPADPTGDWQLSVTASTGQTLPIGTLHIEKAGAGYSATLQAAGQRLEAISPLITDKEVSLTFSNLEQGRVVKMLLAGTIEGDVIKGSMSLDEPGAQRGSFTATRSTAAAGSPAGVGVLSIQVGIVYKMGGSQAVARVPFFLLNKDLNAILSEAGLSPDRGLNLLQTFAFATRYQSQSKYAQFYQAAMRAVQPHIVAQTITGFDGVGQFPAVGAGVYYVMGYTQTRGGFALWNVSVGVPTGQSSLVLDQNNAAIAL